MGIAVRRSANSWREVAFQEIARAEKLKPTVSPWSPNRPSPLAVQRANLLVKTIVDDLPIPVTSTSPEGTICFEWQQDDNKLMFFVHDDGLIEFYGRLSSRPSPIEAEIRDRLDQVNELIRLVFPVQIS